MYILTELSVINLSSCLLLDNGNWLLENRHSAKIMSIVLTGNRTSTNDTHDGIQPVDIQCCRWAEASSALTNSHEPQQVTSPKYKPHIPSRSISIPTILVYLLPASSLFDVSKVIGPMDLLTELNSNIYRAHQLYKILMIYSASST